MGTPRSGRAGGAVDVELVDGPDEVAPGRFGGWLVPPPPRPAAGRRGRRRHRLALAAVVVVVAVVVTVATVRQARTDALLAGLGEGGVELLPLDHPLRERWRADVGAVGGDMGPLVLVADADGTRALDARSGAERWERARPAGTDEECSPLADLTWRTLPAVGSQGPGTPSRAVTPVLCLGSRAVGGDADTPTDDAARTTTVTRLDGGSGEPGPMLTVAGVVVASHVHGGDLVLVTAADDASLRLTRWHPGTGAVQWRREVRPAEAAGLRYVGWQQGVLTLATRAGTLAFNLDSGREMTVTEPLPARVVAVERHLLPRGGVEVVWGFHEEGGFPGGAGVLVHRDDREVPLAGPPLPVAVDDGSVPGLVLVATSPTTVGAVDVATGAVRWEADGSPDAQVTARVGGVAVLVDATGATALDVRTGDVLWHAGDVADEPGSLGLTDGARVLLRHAGTADAADAGDDDADDLAAHDLRTGEVAWTARLPAGTLDVRGTAGGRVVAVGDGWVAGLG
ncbi:outer membrane protein assembly factor BamB family protein [Actinotalea solisilvae]|uniref:outer membrane protein assembly factor BamB family protein n=1 Tax=Actinotalea solisilvae TaxID=2072922 RepID=UPI0018F13EE8|nr:PQQ-binding-like beta-propeller repeat protein [Actinotalea solisilvae]